MFRLCVLPSPALNLPTEQVIRPHGLDLAKTRHIFLGTFNAQSVQFSAFIFFPNAARCSGSNSIKNALSQERQEDLYDKIIFPAANEAILDPSVQELPRNYRSAYAKTWSFQERPDHSRWGSNDANRSVRLKYAVPARFLRPFWEAIVRRANSFRLLSQQGVEVAYFEDPELLFQSHDLKNTLGGETLEDSLQAFEHAVLQSLDPAHLDLRSCFLDIGTRDRVTEPSPQHGQYAEAQTLLWKSRCNRHLHDRLCEMAPTAPISATFYRGFLLRDVGDYQCKARVRRASHQGHPNHEVPGVIRAKAYNCNKEIFGVMFSDYRICGSDSLSLLALNEQMIRGLSSSSQGAVLMPVNHPTRAALLNAWEANKRHLRAISEPTGLTSYGVRKEMTFRLETILTMWHRGDFEGTRNPHVGKLNWTLPLGPGAAHHSPFWIVRTKDINTLIFTQASRFSIPLDHLFRQAHLDNDCSSPQLILAFYTSQLFCRLLKYSLSSETKFAYDNWMWLTKWRVRNRQSHINGESFERYGLGIDDSISNYGMPWIPPDCMNWHGGHIALRTLVWLYLPRVPLQARLLNQRNVQSFSASKISVEYVARQWILEARFQFRYGDHRKAEELARRITLLAAEEVARSYHIHMLAKLQTFWSRVFPTVGHLATPRLRRLQLALEDSVAPAGRIVTAQTIWEIYNEAWATFTRATLEDLPEELPRWMLTRKLLPPRDGWSDFVFRTLFDRPTPPSWNKHDFLELYRKFRSWWETIQEDAGSFESHFSTVIGNYVLVCFNSDQSKEIGANAVVGSWYEDQPAFFRVQFWAPYFSPPERDMARLWESVADYERECPALSLAAISQTVDADDVQNLANTLKSLWSQIVPHPERLQEMSVRRRNKTCREALQNLARYVGPQWHHDGTLRYVRPWNLGRPQKEGGDYEEPFRVAVSAKTGSAMIRRMARKPTILFPSHHNAMTLIDGILSLTTLSCRIRQEARRLRGLLDCEKDYAIRTHLEVKHSAVGLEADSSSLLQQFLNQVELPQQIVLD